MPTNRNRLYEQNYITFTLTVTGAPLNFKLSKEICEAMLHESGSSCENGKGHRSFLLSKYFGDRSTSIEQELTTVRITIQSALKTL